MSPSELQRRIEELLATSRNDADLRTALEQLAANESSFSGFTWLWGPALYKRNRVLFRPFIQSRFSTWMQLPKWRTEVIRWKGDKAASLDVWLAEVDRNDDVDLFRRLYEWKLSERFDWKRRGERAQEMTRELLGRFKSASTPAQRGIVLRKLDLWFELSEEEAVQLYKIDAHASGDFILRHLKTGWLTGGPKREIWSDLLKAASESSDSTFYWKLYRRQVPLKDWAAGIVSLSQRISNAEELMQELQKRHPEGWNLNLSDGFFELVRHRGRDVFPYVMRHLRNVWGGYFSRGSYGKMADYARERGWWDLWSALIRTCATTKEFNRTIDEILKDPSLDETEMRPRLLSLAGVSREWNWAGFGFATTHQLDEITAAALYSHAPDLLRGPFKVHVQAHVWGQTYPKLLQSFIDAADEEMIDYLASRLVTRFGRWGKTQEMVSEADRLADYYSRLKSNEAEFSRRAAVVLGQVPAYSIFNYNTLIRENRLARLLFERSVSSYLADPRSMADLVEGAEIHVQALAYRALGLNDDRARKQASHHLPLLLGTLLRPLQRHTRALAFGALLNAANTAETARMIHERARDALNLPDTRYPKEKLLGLIGQLLHRWPEFRSPGEQPRIYERAA